MHRPTTLFRAVRSVVAKDTVSAMMKLASEIDESASDGGGNGTVPNPKTSSHDNTERRCQGHGVRPVVQLAREIRRRFWRGSLRNGHFCDGMLSHRISFSLCPRYGSKNVFFIRNVVRNREAIEDQKIRCKAPEKRKRKRKNMKAKSPSNGPLLAPLSTEAQKSNFHKRKQSFLHMNFWMIFCGVLASARTTGKRKKEDGKKEKRKKNKKKGEDFMWAAEGAASFLEQELDFSVFRVRKKKKEKKREHENEYTTKQTKKQTKHEK